MNFLHAAIGLSVYSLIVYCLVAFIAQRVSRKIRESCIVSRSSIADTRGSCAASRPGYISDIQHAISTAADKITTNIQDKLISRKSRKRKKGIFATLFEAATELAHAAVSPDGKRKRCRHFNALV
ncbi:MAG: hypothetical protein HQL08_13580 [Nitrospirae bacterium]|nr:hypothetical protein [Nitrospirota bacterium]